MRAGIKCINSGAWDLLWSSICQVFTSCLLEGGRIQISPRNCQQLSWKILWSPSTAAAGLARPGCLAGRGDSTGGTGSPAGKTRVHLPLSPSSPTPFSVGSPPKFSSTYQSDSHSQCSEGSATPSSGRCWSPLTSLHGQRSLGRSVSQKPPTGFQRCGRRQRLALGPGGEGLSRVSRALASSPGQEVSRRPPEPQPEGQGPAALGGGGHGCCELPEPAPEPVQTRPVAWVRTGRGAGCSSCAA